MIRADKTLREMMDEKPLSRWDPKYWHPEFEKTESFLRKLKFPIHNLGSVIEFITKGNGSREWAKKGEDKVRFVQVVNVLNTGIDFGVGDPDKHFAKKEGLGDPSRSRLKDGDILLLSGATGSIGRITMIPEVKTPTNISQDITLIRLKEDSPILPAYFVVFLLSAFGQKQIERYSKGVSGQIKITFDHIKSILIPNPSKHIQDNIKEKYENVLICHDNAMKAKEKGDEVGYKKNIETAKRILKDLIVRTEAVIRGEQDDVI